MKKFITITLALSILTLTGCAKPTATKYVTNGHYYDGYLIRADGHIWDYTTTKVEPDSPVYIIFDDNGTPKETTDDIVLDVFFDVEKIYMEN